MQTRAKVGIGLIALVALSAVGTWYRSSKSVSPDAEYVRVERGTLVSSVSVTGRAEPTERIALAFPTGGTLGELFVEEGDTVEGGALVAVLGDSGASGRVGELEARLSRERAALRDLEAGATIESRRASESTVARALSARTRADEELRQTLTRAYTLAQSALVEGADTVFTNAQGPSPRFGIEFEYGTTDYVIQADREAEHALTRGRIEAGKLLAIIERAASSPQGELRSEAEAARAALGALEGFFNLLTETINRYTPRDASAQTVYRSLQSPVASGRTSISTARSALETALSARDAAHASYTVAEQELAVATAPARAGAREAQQALVAAAQEALRSALSTNADRTLRSPIAGTITNVTKHAGEVALAGSAVAELIVDGAYELEVFIPEADIDGIALGNKARVTFDAFDREDVFGAEVVRIALGETVREGVPTYKTTLVITSTPGEHTIRPGMTADIEIETDRREDVLFVPSRSVLGDGTRRYVRIPTARGTFEERTVSIGLRGSEGMIEITSGLAEGEEVVLFVAEE